MPMPLAERARDNGSGHPGGDLFDAGGTQLTDHDAERQMLGILLTNPVATTETIEIVRPHDLHDPTHRRLYELLIHGYETDTPVTAAGLVAGLGGNVTPALNEPTSAWLARLMADADMKLDVAEIADHLQAVSERRAVGTADDVDYLRVQPFVSKFGAQA